MPIPQNRGKIKLSWWLLLTVIIALTTLAALLLAAQSYQHDGIDRQNYKGAEHYEILFEQAIDRCIKKKVEGDLYACDESFGLIEKFNAISDLETQVTVAHATQGLLWMGTFQAFAALATMGLLVWTVYQTYGILTQTEKTNVATGAMLTSARNTERAYLVIEFECDFVKSRDDGEQITGTFHLNAHIRNAGKTPAFIEGQPTFQWEWVDAQNEITTVYKQYWTDTTLARRIKDSHDFIGPEQTIPVDSNRFNGTFNPEGFYGRRPPSFYRHFARVRYTDINGTRYQASFNTDFYIAGRSAAKFIQTQPNGSGVLSHESYVDKFKPVYYSTSRTEKEIHRIYKRKT